MKTVLIVDDNQHLREILAAILRRSGYRPIEAATGKEAIAKAASDKPHVPHTMHDALALWQSSDFAREAFGDDVVDHYANMAAVELESYNSTITDWERRRDARGGEET